MRPASPATSRAARRQSWFQAVRWDTSRSSKPGTRPTRSIAAYSGSLMAGSREVCRATILSTVTVLPSARLRTVCWVVRGLLFRTTTGASETSLAAMPIRMSEVRVRQRSHTVSGTAVPACTWVRWRPSRSR